MDKFIIPEKAPDKESINRTIRWRGVIYDKLMEITEKHKISFNQLVNEMCKFALERFDKGE